MHLYSNLNYASKIWKKEDILQNLLFKTEQTTITCIMKLRTNFLNISDLFCYASGLIF